LIVAANRDEFYARPTSPAGFWEESPHIYAGRDLEKGGTWLGVNTNGQFAALTNFRDPSSRKSNVKSRGLLVSSFLATKSTSAEFMATVEREAANYDGFNFVAGDRTALHYFSSRNNDKQQLTTGIYGVSNHLLDTPWPKLTRAKEDFRRYITRGEPAFTELFDLLADRFIASDTELPETGIGIEWERKLSSIFIASADYGTRSSTIILFHHTGKIHFQEKRFGKNGDFIGESKHVIESEPYKD